MLHDEDYDCDDDLYDYDEIGLELAVNLLTGINPAVYNSTAVFVAVNAAANYAAHRFQVMLAADTETTELGRAMLDGIKEVTGDN